MPSILNPDSKAAEQTLERNLKAIEQRSPKAAAQIRAAAPSTAIEFGLAPTGDLFGIMDGRALCSKRNPQREADAWAEKYDPQDSGFLGILGFGLGHHLKSLHNTHQNRSVLLCFEPDVELLRAVLERIDHSQWINESIFMLATDPNDAPTITQLITNAEAFVATGVELAAHPPSQRRLDDSANQFSSTLLNVVRSTRTHLITVLAHSGITLRNILMNTGTYASSVGITPLKDACKDRTAILIAAGPSLKRNLHLLENPAIREQFVIIAVQTMLKPLLERGIKPHFITALDHHEISKRFYEGLTAQDVQGVRLIAEPKANAAIIEAFPGEILCTTEPQLDELLGEDLYKDMGQLPAGATVAHLNYYLARYMGCSNIILIGQDLGFTDGQYYASGASIHKVWSGELSEHRTLEMFEWERIARMKNLLRVKQDIHDRHIYTDEQMSTYIAQFENDFQSDTHADSNLRIINATEGGVKIAYTEVMTLQDALKQCLNTQPINIPDTLHLLADDPQRTHKIQSQLELVIRQLKSIQRDSQRTLDTIAKAQGNIDDPAHVDRCVAQLHKIRDDVMANKPGFGLVNFINQRGGLNRFKVDRKIALLKDLSPTQIQAKKLDRDAHNVRWVKDSAKQVQRLVERALGFYNGTAQPLTRDEFADKEPTIELQESSTRRVEAVIFADPELGPLGFPRNLDMPIYQELNPLELTIKRLAKCTQLDGITIITSSPDQINAMALFENKIRVQVVAADQKQLRARIESVGKARMASSECWRGSIASFGCYDEALEPTILARVMDEHHIDAAAIVGSDWAMIDPSLVDRIIARHRADPDRCHIPFSQAVPGLGCFVIDRGAVETLDHAYQSSSVLASTGAMLSYIPIGPQGDPIASPLCVDVDPLLRDAGVRVIADSTTRFQAMAAAYRGLGELAMTADSTILIKAFANELNARQLNAPSRIELELTTQRHATGLWGKMHSTPSKQTQMDSDQACTLLQQARLLRDDCTVLFSGRGDPLASRSALSIIQSASQLGLANIELRTDLVNQPHQLSDILSSGIDVLSVDILADTPPIYETMTGNDNFNDLLDQMQSLFNTRKETQLTTPWIVPRITRCDAAYSDIQSFYDRWITVCGCAIIDPLPPSHPTPHQFNTGDRIQPLVVPEQRAAQLAQYTLRIQADGQVVSHLGEPVPNTNAFELGIEQSYKNFRQFLVQPNNTHIEPKSIHDPVAAS